MKRKQWLACILALAMLLSLVPAFSASASELEDGQIIADGIAGINDIATFNVENGRCEYVQNHCIMTLFHEVGHLFNAKDHYGQYENGKSMTTEEMNRCDYDFAGMYSDQCIYSERRHEFDDPFSLPFCDGCRGNIMANKDRYYI